MTVYSSFVEKAQLQKLGLKINKIKILIGELEVL